MDNDHLGSSICPGCGLELPNIDWPQDERRNSSPSCWKLYTDISGAGLDDPALTYMHQLRVDTYTAQHVGRNTPPIGSTFALIGLHLAIDKGYPGLEVRRAHQTLARLRGPWPRLRSPGAIVEVTVNDLFEASTKQEQIDMTNRWAVTVWDAWRSEHGRIERLVTETLL
ncbi:MAG: DUF5946 family protein [Actinomycetota bacterium]